MIRGEVVAIQAVVFNYMNKEITAELTFENIGDFQFMDDEDSDNEITRSKSKFFDLSTDMHINHHRFR